MKAISLLLVSIISMSAFGQSSLEMDQINLSGNLLKRSRVSKIVSRRRKFEDQTTMKVFQAMEVERIKFEARLRQKVSNSIEKSMSNIEVK